MSSPILAFADDTWRTFCSKWMLLRRDWEWCSSQKQADRTLSSGCLWQPSTHSPHEKNYQSTKLEFLVLKWAVTEHFKEYLLYQPFLVKTDNNPLTYIMTTPNLDAAGQLMGWSPSKVQFRIGIPERAWDNASGRCAKLNYHLSWPGGHVQPILDGATLGATQRAEGEDPAMVEVTKTREVTKKREVQVTAGLSPSRNTCHQLGHSPKRRPWTRCSTVQWLEAKKKTDLRTLLGEHASSEEGQIVWQELHQNFTGSPRRPLSVIHAQRGEWWSITLCGAKGAHWTVTLNGCHQRH